MKKLLLFLVALLLLATCLAACAAGAGDPSTQSKPAEDADTPQRSWRLQLEEVNNDIYSEDGRLLVQARYELPQMTEEGTAEALTTNTAAAEQINRYFTQWMEQQQQFLEDIGDMAREHYRMDQMAGGADGRWNYPEYSYSDIVSTDYWSNGRLLCISMHNSTYSGGAHPNSWQEAVSFDLSTARSVTIPDLTDRLEELRDAVTDRLLRQIREDPDYDEGGYFPDYEDTVAEWMDKTIIFGEEGLTLVFAPYDIASYAAGEQTFLLLYRDLEPYFNDYARKLLGL